MRSPEVAADPAAVARRLFAGIADEYDLLAELLSFGQNARWRRFLLSRVAVPADGRVLDVATGTARVARAVAQRTPAAIVGLDQSPAMLAAGVRALDDAGLTARIGLVRGDARCLPFPDRTFDAVTFTYLLRYVADPPATLAELARTLRPGGTLAGLEFSRPDSLPLQAAWWLHTRVGLPLAGALVSRSWYEVGRFLGPSIDRFYQRFPLESQRGWWSAAGIEDVHVRVMSWGGGVVMWGRKSEGGGSDEG